MSAPDPTPVPLRLTGRPTIGGLVVPWLTGLTSDGRHRFGTIDADRLHLAHHNGLCQICGDRLNSRIVFAMRIGDIRRLISPEPGMHPECAAYSATACPMLAGRMTHYRAAPTTAGITDLNVAQLGDPHHARPGTAAEMWCLVWVSRYQPILDPVTRLSAALILPESVLRIRRPGGDRD
jgi:hypothetical protein